MSIGVRVFILDDNRIEQIPYAKYDRLMNNSSDENLRQYAGKRIKTAVAYVRIHNRNPAALLKIDYTYLSINQKGKIDQDEQQHMMIDAMRTVPFPFDEDIPENIIDSSSTFAQKTFKNKYLWTPTDGELNRINQLIFKNGKGWKR